MPKLKSLPELVNAIHHGDCIAGMNALPAGSVDLAFADPPFNIGYDYDVYDDRQEHQQYLDWSRNWIAAVHRVLKDDGTFWLAIGDEYAAELKVASQEIGFHCRSWVIWYYTFGVNCKNKFTRSHAHLFYFVKDPKHFTFRGDDLDNRIPSARQLVYQDKRANPRGRLPDDTWIIRPADVVGELIDDAGVVDFDKLSAPRDDEQTWQIRPQDVEACFTAEEDTWYFPRVAGTFKERKGFHGCQMPEQLLGRIVRSCSNETDVVLDPFSGSATTLAVAKKLGRKFIGFDLSEDYIAYGRERLESIRIGDRLDGSPEPLMSAPKTGGPRIQGVRRPKDNTEAQRQQDRQAVEQRYDEVQLQLTLQGIVEAFRLTHDGFSADRVVADPELNDAFTEACCRIGIAGCARTWNLLLFRLRKAGKLAHLETTQATSLDWRDCDRYLFASEIALQMMLDEERASSLDEILCDPALASEFDKAAARLAPGHSPFEYRWVALKIRKQAKTARTRAAVLAPPSRLGKRVPIAELDVGTLETGPGVYVLSEASQRLYVGESLNLSQRVAAQFASDGQQHWADWGERLTLQTFATQTEPADMLAWQSCLASKFKSRLNFCELRCST